MPDRPKYDVDQVVQASAVLHVPDVLIAAEYYRDVLGFNLDFVFGDPPEYSVVWRDNGAIHFSRSDEPSSNVHLFIWVKDVDALYEDLVQRGADITLRPTTQPYGIRECAVTDLNGIKVVFGQDDELYHGE